MRHIPSVTLVLGALVVAGVTIVVDPMESVHPSALRRYALAGGCLVVHTLACVFGGAALLQRWSRPAPESGRAPVAWLPALVTGWFVWGMCLLPVAMLGALSHLSAWLPVLVLGPLAFLRPTIAPPRPSTMITVTCGLVGLVGLIDAGAPPIDTDELYQHLALPSQALRSGSLPSGVLHPDGSRPQLLTLIILPLLSAGTDTAPRLFSTLCAVGILLGSEEWIRTLTPRSHTTATGLVALLLAGSYTFLQEVGLAANNLPTALAVLGAARSGLSASPVPLIACAGTALSFKYTAAGPMVGIWLWTPQSLRARLATGTLALLCISPWWIRNGLDGLHPLFPYAGWDTLPTGAPPGDLTFQYLEKYGAGRSLRDLLLLPWNAVMTAEVGSFRFLGRLTPLTLLLAPFSVVAFWRHRDLRPVIGLAAIICVAWASGPHWLRHLLPGLAVVAIALGTAAARVAATQHRALALAAGIVVAAGSAANFAPLAERLADRLPAALGQEDRDTYLLRTVRSAPAVHWLNQNLPEDAVVAVLYEWPGHLIHRTTLLGSVEDHVPTRYWLLVHQEDSLDALAKAGATHLVVGRFRFLRKWYPFLSDEVFESMFEAPTTLLETVLLKDGTLVFESNHTRVYRLATAEASTHERARTP